MALFNKVLVANRGEIAIRIMDTLNKLGIKSVAVYSEADSNSLHVQRADESYFIGNAPATESYLSVQNIISAIRDSGADAVHPGYGFLSENHSFANALKREKVTLIGPSAASIKKMGDKIEAKKVAIESGVNTVPGYIGTIKNVTQAIEIATQIGYPVIVKAAAGGGGRGMRVVKNDNEMLGAFESARLEAENSFSDGRVFIEKFIEHPRHIEIQVLADRFGNAICLGERECSIQRRHQKVIEEAPSVFIDEEIRNRMYSQVLSLVEKVGYHSAGTVEFIVDQSKKFYFLEMNTRLQVEHCVTELITGIDIVEQMIRIAAGEKLLIKQEDVVLNGWAIESRICAEDPKRGFLPSSGRITEYVEPIKTPNIRIDSGIAAGGEVSMFYDPMIAKLCTHAPTREEAIKLMLEALGSFVIRGISHNISFLEAIIAHSRFVKGELDTKFIEDVYPDGFLGADVTSEATEVFLATAIHVFISEQKRASILDNQVHDYFNHIGTRWVVFIENNAYPVFIKPVADGYNIRSGRNRIYVRSNWTLGSKLFTAEVNGRKIHVKVEHIPTGYNFTHLGASVKVYVRSPRVAELESIMLKKNEVEERAELLAPLSGQIVAIKTNIGDEVEPGQDLLVLTAMKMENIITAMHKAKIVNILVKPGDQVTTGQVLLEFE